MKSPLLDCTHGQTWHDITALEQHTRSNDVGRGMTSPLLEHAQSDDVKRGMTSPPLESTHGRNDVRNGMPSSPLGSIHSRTTLGVACHLGPWTTYTVERHQAWHAIIAFKPADTVGRRRAWHAIIALGRQTQSNDVEGCMPCPPLKSTHSRTTSGVACHQRPWTAHTIG